MNRWPWFGLIVATAAAVAFGLWLVTGPLHRDDPNHPPAQFTWHACPYTKQEGEYTFASATAHERGAVAYQDMSLAHIGDDGGLPIYGLPLNVSNPYPCNGPWTVYLKTGADRYTSYMRPGGP